MIVKLPSEITIAFVAELRTVLLAALSQDEPVELDAGHVSLVDAAGLQLLCATHRSAVRRRKNLSLTGDCSAVFASAASRAGMLRDKGCESGCIWSQVHHD